MTDTGTEAPETEPTFAAKFLRAITPPPWDAMIKLGVKSIPSNIVGIVGAALLKKIMGPDAWERDVSEKLGEILAKLDRLMFEIQALKKYITEALLKQWQSELKTETIASIGEISRIVTAIRKSGELNEEDRKQLRFNADRLRHAMSKICHATDVEGKPASVPLYPAVAAGAPVLNLAQHLLGNSEEVANEDLSFFSEFLTRTATEMDSVAKSMISAVAAGERYLLDYPKKGFVCWASSSGLDYLDVHPVRREGIAEYLCYAYAEISDGIDAEFFLLKSERIGLGNYRELMWDPTDPMAAVFGTKFPLVPTGVPLANQRLDVGGNGAIIHAMVYATWIDRMLVQLNESRNAVISDWMEIRKAQGTAASMRSAADHLRSLRTPPADALT